MECMSTIGEDLVASIIVLPLWRLPADVRRSAVVTPRPGPLHSWRPSFLTDPQGGGASYRGRGRGRADPLPRGQAAGLFSSREWLVVDAWARSDASRLASRRERAMAFRHHVNDRPISRGDVCVRVVARPCVTLSAARRPGGGSSVARSP